MQCPWCLRDAANSSARDRVLIEHHLECARFSGSQAISGILCSRTLYECNASAVLIYLPPFNSSELSVLYSVYTGQRALSLQHPRPMGQAELIATHAAILLNQREPLHVVELGCAGGFMLGLLARRLNRGKITCFEADSKMAPQSEAMMHNISEASGGRVSARVVRSFFSASELPADHHVDLITSSHVSLTT